MPRTFSTAVLGEIRKRLGSEPILILEVEWSDGLWVAYTDRKLNGEDYPYPYLVDSGVFDTTTVVNGGTDTQNISITLNDVDGELRKILDTIDIHLRPARVYLGFQGLPYTEKALMFEGLINSPIVWDESGRTLQFEVMSKLEDTEAGFTMEDGDFPFVPPSDRNKAWPLVFGQVCNMEAVQVTALRKGFLAEGLGAVDPTITERLCQANNLRCPKHIVTETVDDEGTPGFEIAPPFTPTTPPNTGTGDGGQSPVFAPTPPKNIDTDTVDQACLNRRFSEICKILQEKTQQEKYAKSKVIIRGGERFPQNEEISVKIGEVRYEGIMDGEEFTILRVFHPDLDRIDNPECLIFPEDPGYGWRDQPKDEGGPTSIAECLVGGDEPKKKLLGAADSWRHYELFEAGSFIWLPPGTDVYLTDEAEVTYVVSLLPGTVDQVAAYRTYGDTTLLTEVPTEYYTVNTVDYGGYEVVEVTLTQPLSTISNDEDWEDNIYVSFTSSVGPNPVAIIEWLLEKYTNYSTDAESFNQVKSEMSKYPSNFYLKERTSVLQLIRDIAYQARCALYIRDNTVYITYLSKEPVALRTLTKSDIVANSFRITHTETEQLATRHKITWKNGDAGVNRDDETNFEFVIKHNVPKYGRFEKDVNYYTQNTFETILKSATFWMIRDATTWKYIEFQTPMHQLELDVFDCVAIDIPQFPKVKVVIQETSYNVNDNTITFKCWTPIRSGESQEYFWAWPAFQVPNAVFPLLDSEQESGDGYDFEVIPPEGHPLYGGYDPENANIQTEGDRFPSDRDDEFPLLECVIATGAEIADDIEPEIRIIEPVANENFNNRLDGIEKPGVDGGGGNNDDKEKKPGACGQPSYGQLGCAYEVTVTYILPELVAGRALGGKPVGCGKACYGPCDGDCGLPCAGPVASMCHDFGSLWGASVFRSGKLSEKPGRCAYVKGVWQVYLVGGIKAIPDPGATLPGQECEDPSTVPEPPQDGKEAAEEQQEKSKPRPTNPNNPNNPDPLPGYEGGGRGAPKKGDGSGQEINNPYVP